MTRPADRWWRGAGVVLLVAGGLAGAVSDAGTMDGASVLLLLGFPLAMLGLVLVVQGRRAPLAIRVECSRHRMLPERLHARRGDTRRRR
ncbi:hypothetical protein [Sphingomonas sp. R1]|uniref:hypothetical protein n=1 Tax=Sphingomonas sp. R1 TaxID=399176 RepID=UPI0022245B42|nr:hypothetical protein [Sphingomonas sp. R1]UYY77547.1 hypothetical protein OIM94_00610 [Sphingomonas sp. R1]